MALESGDAQQPAPNTTEGKLLTATSAPALEPARPPQAPQAAVMPRTIDDEVVPQLVSAMRTQFRNGIGEAKIRLNPEHLGSVHIDLKIEGGRVSAVLQVERADVRQALESQSDSLRTQLAGQGLTLEHLTVSGDDAKPRAERDASHSGRGGSQPQPERRPRKRPADKEFELTEG